MVEIQNSIIEMKNAFDGRISRLDLAEVRISEIEETPEETCQT